MDEKTAAGLADEKHKDNGGKTMLLTNPFESIF